MSDESKKAKEGTRIPPERLAEVRRRLLAAEAPADIERELSKEWFRTERQIRSYITIVRRQMAEEAKQNDPGADLEISRAMLLAAFRTAKTGTTRTVCTSNGTSTTTNEPDPHAMVNAAKMYAQITGAAAPTKIKHDVGDGLAGLIGQAFDDDDK